MIVVPTQKLLFNRFTHCIKLGFVIKKDAKGFFIRNNGLIRSVKMWLAANNVPNRTRLDWHFKDDVSVDVTFGIYLNDENAYAELLETNKDIVRWTSRPATEQHKDLLLNKTEIEFRKQLFYNNFRYKVMFRTGWRREKMPEIVNWLNDQFEGRTNGRRGDYLFVAGWVSNLYLKDDTDMLMARLSMSELVTRIVRIELFQDHGMTRAPDSQP